MLIITIGEIVGIVILLVLGGMLVYEKLVNKVGNKDD